MDYCSDEQNDSSVGTETFSNTSSPKMFDSDDENESDTENIVSNEHSAASPLVNPYKLSQVDLIANSDNYRLSRINEFLNGVPPPPRHTVCQSDCIDFLLRIKQNRHCFWIPYRHSGKEEEENSVTVQSSEQEKVDDINKNSFYRRAKCISRNLSDAFDECDSQANASNKESYVPENTTSCSNSNVERNAFDKKCDILSVDNVSNYESSLSNSLKQDDTKVKKENEKYSNDLRKQSYFSYSSATEEDVASLTWPEAYRHKFHGIHYNRNRAVEEFENLTTKLCERYIGAETQSSFNVFFSKQALGNVKKRRLLAKSGSCKSPRKRLTDKFSKANLPALELKDKKQLLLDISTSRKPVNRKEKSPGDKSPRESVKKKVARRLVLDGPSPQKSRLEMSKRALFQSPTFDYTGSSKTTTVGHLDQQKIKRALFPTPTKKHHVFFVIDTRPTS